MTTIVRCAMLAPALAFGLPVIRAEDKPEQKSAPAALPQADRSSVPVSPSSAKSIPPFLSAVKPPPPSSSPAPAAPTGVSTEENAAKKPPANPEFSSSIRRSFPYAPSAAPAADEVQADTTLPVVDMKPFHVATSRVVERATKGMEERRQKLHDELFNAKDGGRFGKIGPAELGLKFDPKHKGWDILSIPW